MSHLHNLTEYGAISIPSMGQDGRDLVLAVTAARFRLPHPKGPAEQPLAVDEQQPQPPPPLGDAYAGDPARSGLRVEGQSAFVRPATDITVTGHARALHDRPVTSMKVAVRVGSCAQEAVIVGDRVWEAGLSLRGVKMSPPFPFVQMPLLWERAFGGSVFDEKGRLVASDPRNPVGRGIFRDAEAARGQAVANIEDPRQPIQGPGDRPAPVGFGPIARWWQPRAGFAGTYDEAWLRDRAPLWPADFDERFFCAAPPALQASPHLRGGEPVQLEGLHPEGTMRFRLPAPRMVARFRFNGRDVRRAMVLDAVIVEPDTGHLTLIHRAAAPVSPSMAAHRETVIRHIEGWEELVA